MASGRFLSISIAEDDRLGQLSMTAEFLFLKVIPHLDRDGLITGRPGLLWAKICPLREGLFEEMPAIIGEWIAVGLAHRYQSNQELALFFPGFAKNNNLPHYKRERPSRFTPPPGYYRTDDGLFPFDTKLIDRQEAGSTDDPDEIIPSHLPDEVQESVQRDTPVLDAEDQEEDQEEAASRVAAPTIPKSASRNVSPFVCDYESIWGLMISSPHISEKITEWEGRVTLEGWRYALKECADNQKVGQWKYFESILRRIEREGFLPRGPTKPLASATVDFALEDIDL